MAGPVSDLSGLNSQSRFSPGLARASCGWLGGGGEETVVTIILSYPQIHKTKTVSSSNNLFGKMSKYKYFAEEIKETFHECLGCGNKRNISLCNILFVFVQCGKENISGNNLSYIEH